MKLRPEAVQRVLESLKRTADYEFLFAKLSSADWVEPLANAGFFRRPPEVEHSGTTVRFPFWPESDFLARVAAQKPRVVAEQLLSIPETSNARVHEDFVDAALAMPPNDARRIAQREIAWIAQQQYLYFQLPEKYVSLAKYLASQNEVAEARGLIEVVFAVLPDKDDSTRPLHPEPKSRMDHWDYNRLLPLAAESLGVVSPYTTIEVLADLLQSAIAIQRAGAAGAEDYSFAWQRDLTSSLAYERGIEHTLAVTTTILALRVTNQANADIAGIVECLERRPYKLFRRIALRILSEAPNTAASLAHARLLDPALFDDLSVLNEFAALEERWFGTLDRQGQETILSRIAQGRRERLGVEHEKLGHSVSEEDLTRWNALWQRDRLSPMRDSLPVEWRQRFDMLVDQYGPPVFDRHSSTPVTVRWGSPSPTSIEEMRLMSVEDITQLLHTWQPDTTEARSFESPTREGLASTLVLAVRERPGEFSRELESLSDVHPYFSARILGALRDAVRAKERIAWGETLAGIGAILERLRSGAIEPEQDGVESTEQWIRRDAAALIEQGLASDVSGPPIQMRSTVWALLSRLAEDPDPTPESEAGLNDANMDALTMSINTVRGQALHAVIQYALWVREELSGEGQTALARSVMPPEVTKVLERHLDVSVDPAVSVRALYGQRFPWLILLDRDWAQRHAGIVFPTEPGLANYWRAAWESFLIYNRFYESAFEVLSMQYESAVNGLASTVTEGQRVSESLAEHLMVAMWQGHMPEPGDPGVLTRFFEKATPDLRGHALEFIGRALANSEHAPPEDVLNRIVALWNWRRELADASQDASAFEMELTKFGSWIGAPGLDPAWQLANLEWALRKFRDIEPSYSVFRSLPLLGQYDVVAALRCARLLVTGQSAHAPYLAHRDELKILAKEARRAANTGASQELERLVNDLGARGYRDARALLFS